MGPMAHLVSVEIYLELIAFTKKCPLWGRWAVVRVRRNDPYGAKGPVVGVQIRAGAVRPLF
jgi:hypothetical protein